MTMCLGEGKCVGVCEGGEGVGVGGGVGWGVCVFWKVCGYVRVCVSVQSYLNYRID
jgi:hypothetical protein